MDDRLLYYKEKLKSIEKSNGKSNDDKNDNKKDNSIMDNILTSMDIDKTFLSLRNCVLELTNFSIKLSDKVEKSEKRFLTLQKKQLAEVIDLKVMKVKKLCNWNLDHETTTYI